MSVRACVQELAEARSENSETRSQLVDAKRRIRRLETRMDAVEESVPGGVSDYAGGMMVMVSE